MGNRYGGKGFYEYHKQFSAKAAAHLKYHNVKVDWSVRSNTLFCNIFANYKPLSCNLCQAVGHTSNFCPKNLEGKKPEKVLDTYGGARVYLQGREICNNFNSNAGCNRSRCSHLHICLTCKKDHPKSVCNDTKNGWTARGKTLQ